MIPGSGRSSREGKGYLVQYSGLEDSTDCIVHGVAKNRIRLSDFHFISPPGKPINQLRDAFTFSPVPLQLSIVPSILKSTNLTYVD